MPVEGTCSDLLSRRLIVTPVEELHHIDLDVLGYEVSWRFEGCGGNHQANMQTDISGKLL